MLRYLEVTDAQVLGAAAALLMFSPVGKMSGNGFFPTSGLNDRIVRILGVLHFLWGNRSLSDIFDSFIVTLVSDRCN
ncbi:MAG: hypothetical protein ACYT04_41385 [Nostoc sp.]